MKALVQLAYEQDERKKQESGAERFGLQVWTPSDQQSSLFVRLLAEEDATRPDLDSSLQ